LIYHIIDIIQQDGTQNIHPSFGHRTLRREEHLEIDDGRQGLRRGREFRKSMDYVLGMCVERTRVFVSDCVCGLGFCI
jgi:hypothetical protein